MNYYTKKQIFYVNSNNRITGTHSEFSYQLNIDPNEDFDRVSILAASIPKSYYLIDSTYNKFTLKENTNSVVITFPNGNYSRRSLSIVLQNLLNNNSPNNYSYTVTFNNISNSNDNGKFTITVSNNSSIQPEFIFTDQIYEQLGFNKNSTNVFISNSLTSTNVINLTNETTLFIHSNICINNEGDNILQEIYTSGDLSYSMINFINPIPAEYSKVLTSGKNNIYNFWLTDEAGRIIDTNGININFTLMIYKKNDIDNLIKGAIKYFTLISSQK